ncbi:TatD family hydrolase [Candidatus Babeliales bacterium]|nr:TatD family hydrolase [Candidatus Babeliales bacterium]
MIDTHCHLNIMVRNFTENATFIPFNAQELQICTTILNDAKFHEVTSIINVGINLAESLLCVELAQQFSNCFATLGIHPNDITETWQSNLQEFKKILKNKKELKIVGIGECGIDKHYPNFNLKLQQDVFHAQIQLALKHDLALVIHSRNADEETYQALAEYRGEKNFRGTIHCFSSNKDYAKKYLDLNFVLGFGGTITYPKNETLRNVVKMIPLEKIILETDAPFLPPQSMRGKKNNPSNIKIIAEFIANLRGESFETIAQITDQTSRKLFGLL